MGHGPSHVCKKPGSQHPFETQTVPGGCPKLINNCWLQKANREHRAVGRSLTWQKQYYSKDLILLEICAGVKASSRQIPLVRSCFSLARELKDLGNAALHLHRMDFNLVVA